MAGSAGGAAAAAKPASRGAMLDANKLAARTKAHKRKTPPPSDDDDLERDEDAEEETSDSDTGTLAQTIDDKERRAEKLQKLQREKKAEEELDKKLAEQEAKNTKKLKDLTASRNSFPAEYEEVIILLKIFKLSILE